MQAGLGSVARDDLRVQHPCISLRILLKEEGGEVIVSTIQPSARLHTLSSISKVLFSWRSCSSWSLSP